MMVLFMLMLILMMMVVVCFRLFCFFPDSIVRIFAEVVVLALMGLSLLFKLSKYMRVVLPLLTFLG
jgi:hypothetical protein